MVGGETIKKALSETTYLKPPILIDFSRDFHKGLVNWEELGATIVKYTDEGIPKPSDKDNEFALKFSVGAGETKRLRIRVVGGEQGAIVIAWLYLTGDVIAEKDLGSYTGTTPVLAKQNSWDYISARASNKGVSLKFSATSGGSVYVKYIIIYRHGNEFAVSYTYKTVPNKTYDGTIVDTYNILTLASEEQVCALRIVFGGDGTNPLNVDVKLRTADGYRVISSLSRTNSALATYWVMFPVVFYKIATLGQFKISIDVSGNGVLDSIELLTYTIKKSVNPFNGYKEASASNTSTTVTTYTLLDNGGRGNYYRNLKADITIATGGGSVELLINGQSVGTYTTSQTIDLSWFDEPIYKIEANIAGDGTNASSVKVSGYEWLGSYIAY